MGESEIVIRKLKDSDSLESLTELLHRAYRSLAELGLKYFATHQTVEQTRRRIRNATVFVAELDGEVVGTILYRNPSQACHTPWYDREEVAYIGQMGVEPDYKGKGIATKLMAFVEEQARRDGALELAADTAESATHLIAWYERLGYRFIDYVDWEVTNYRSVIMSKRLE